VNLDRIGSITSELSANLLRSIVLPEGIRAWFARPLSDRLRNLYKPIYVAEKAPAAPVIRPGGPVLLFGGPSAPDQGIVEIIHLIGGRGARVAVLPLAATDQEQAGAEAVRLFTRFGVKKVESLGPVTSETLSDPAWCERVAAAEAVVLCGEDPRLGMGLVRGTRCEQTLQHLHAAGKVLAGIAGGAAMLASRFQTATGLAEGLDLASGLVVAPVLTGLIQSNASNEGASIDQLIRILQAERVHGLMGACIRPGAGLILRDGDARVIGDETVTFLDAEAPQSKRIDACGVKAHVLSEGYGINLRSRKPFSPPKEPPRAAAVR